MAALKESEIYYTYADYASWGDRVPRCELVDGIIYFMAAPSANHQRVMLNIAAQLKNFLRGRTCEPFSAPFDVRLNYDEADDIVVQPDILVICDPRKIENGKHCLGAPDLVIEVLSLSTGSYDSVYKLEKYRQYGVREYWLAEPDTMRVKVHAFADGRTVSVTDYERGEKVPVGILPGLEIDLEG